MGDNQLICNERGLGDLIQNSKGLGLRMIKLKLEMEPMLIPEISITL